MSDITTTDNKRVNLEYLATDSRKPKFRCMASFLDYMSPISTRNSPHRAANSSTSKQLLISFHHVSPIILKYSHRTKCLITVNLNDLTFKIYV